MLEVDLTLTEFHAAVSVGMQRLIESSALKLNAHNVGVSRTWMERLGDEVRGALGEIAWAKARNQFFCGSCGTFHHEPDVQGVEIRSMRRPNDSLIVRSNDVPERPFVLSHATGEKVKFFGWIYAKDGMRDEFKKAPRGGNEAWFIPQRALNDFSKFPNEKGGGHAYSNALQRAAGKQNQGERHGDRPKEDKAW